MHVFVPHATAGVALMETGSGSEEDLDELVERLLPRDDRYAASTRERRPRRRSSAAGVRLAILMVPVIGGRLSLGTWQRVVLVDPNRENNVRSVRPEFVAG